MQDKLWQGAGKLLNERLGHGCAAVRTNPPGRQIPSAQAVAQIGTQQAQLVHGRHHQCVGHLLICRQAQKGPDLKLRQDERAAPAAQHGQQVGDEASDVACRCCHNRSLCCTESEAVPVVQNRMDKVQMREHRSLRPPGRARRIENDCACILLWRGYRDASGSVEQLIVRTATGRAAAGGVAVWEVPDTEAPRQVRQLLKRRQSPGQAVRGR